MTRINLVPVEELSDAHLLAEYRELPRAIKQDVDISNTPRRYTLGKGHVKWAAQYPVFLINRYYNLVNEMKHRGFTVNFPTTALNDLAYKRKMELIVDGPSYLINDEDIEISRNRIIERYKSNPKAHKWTNRDKPTYLTEWINDKIKTRIRTT